MKKYGSIGCILFIIVVTSILPVKAQTAETKNVIAIPGVIKSTIFQQIL